MDWNWQAGSKHPPTIGLCGSEVYKSVCVPGAVGLEANGEGGGEERESEKNIVVLGPFLGDIFPLSFFQLESFGTGARQTVTGGKLHVILRCTALAVHHRGRQRVQKPLSP